MRYRFVSNDECAGVTGVAVVVDVLRAFSFAAYALAAGADRLILMDDLDEALRTARSIPRALVGKDGPPRDDFDLFNSPGQLRQRDDIAGRTIVHRTGAGTVGAVAARAAAHVYCASFVVAGATIDRLRVLQEQEITFVITGDQGHAEEDLACAEYMAASLGHATVDPHPFLARAETAGERLQRAAAVGYPGVHEDDVGLCCELDRFDFALRATDEAGLVTLRRG